MKIFFRTFDCRTSPKAAFDGSASPLTFSHKVSLWTLLGLLLTASTAFAEWPYFRGGSGRSGAADWNDPPNPPFSFLTVLEEELGIVPQIIVSGNRLIVQGNESVVCYTLREIRLAGKDRRFPVPVWQYQTDKDLMGEWLCASRDVVAFVEYDFLLNGYGYRIVALDIATGEEIWTRNVVNAGGLQMARYRDQLVLSWSEVDFFMPVRGLLESVNIRTGAELWSKEVDVSEGFSSDVLMAGGFIIRRFLDDYEVFVAERISSGEEVWRFEDINEHLEYVVHRMIANDERVIITQGNRILSLDLRTGALAWERMLVDDLNCQQEPTDLATDGKYIVIMGLCGNQMQVVDFETGDPVWSEVFDDFSNFPTLAINGGKLFFTKGRLIQAPYETIMESLVMKDLATGETLTEIDTTIGMLHGSIAVSNQLVFLGGASVWTQQISVEVYETSPADTAIELISRPLCAGMVGGQLVFEYDILNSGPGPAQKAKIRVVTDPAQNTLITDGVSINGNNSFSVDLGDFGAESKKRVTLICRPLKADEHFTVNVSINSSVREINGDNNQAREEIPVFDSPATPLDLTISGVEITQGIQNLANEVPLIAGKKTLARLYVNTAGATVPGLEAKLHGTRNGEPLPMSPLSPFTECPVIPPNPNRANLTDSINFLLPEEWREGSLTLTFDLNANRKIPEEDYTNNTLERDIFFFSLPPICIKTYPVHTENSNGGSLKPSARVGDRIIAKALSLLPTARIRTFPQGGSLLEELHLWGWGPYEFDTNGDDDNFKVLNTLWWHDQTSDDPDSCDDANARTHYLGIVHKNTAGSYAGVGRRPGDQLVVKMFDDVSETNDPDFPLGGRILAHELGHNYGRRHVDCNDPAGTDGNYPFPACQFAPADPDGFYGTNLYDTEQINIIAPVDGSGTEGPGDLMSYASNRWPSSYTWNAMAVELAGQQQDLVVWPPPTPDAPSAQSGGVLHVNEERIYQRSDLRILSSDEIIMLSGYIADDETTGQIETVYRFAQNTVVPAQKLYTLWNRQGLALEADSLYSAELIDATSQTLALEAFEPGEVAESETGILLFGVTLPMVDGATALQIRRGEEILDRVVFSVTPPVVQITAPTQGAVIDSGQMTISWNGQDADGDDLEYLIQYSSDLGASWITLVANYQGDTITIDTNLLSGSEDACYIQVIASDGFNTASDQVGAFTIAPRPPVVTIHNPADGSVLRANRSFLAEGGAYDPEDGPLTGSSLRWFLNDDSEPVDQGEEAQFTRLPPGEHRLSLVGTDSDGQVTTATISLIVPAPPKPPHSLFLAY